MSNELPDVHKIIFDIEKILEFICTEPMLKLRDDNYTLFKMEVEKQFPEFADSYYGILQLIMRGEDLSNLIHILTGINKVKSGGSTLEEEEEKFMNRMSEQYIPPNLRNPRNRN